MECIVSLSGFGVEPCGCRWLLIESNAKQNNGRAAWFHAATNLQECGKRARRSITSFGKQAELFRLMSLL
jgi:hypothetical protein